MTSVPFRLTLFAGAAALTFALFVLNLAFEAAGSIPDIEGCGYLAGSIPALMVLFPAVSWFITYSTNAVVQRRLNANLPRVRVCGTCMGILGAMAYVGMGVFLSYSWPNSSPVHVESIFVSGVLIVLCAIGGYGGARRNEQVTASIAWRAGKS